jgi:hypothetical protein
MYLSTDAENKPKKGVRCGNSLAKNGNLRKFGILGVRN